MSHYKGRASGKATPGRGLKADDLIIYGEMSLGY
jgi:hypothetical protein